MDIGKMNKSSTGEKLNISIMVLDSLRLSTFNEINKNGNFLRGFNNLETCIAPAPWTLPSHASLFTGLYPSQHGAHETKDIKSLNIEKIKLRKKTFIDYLNKLGYHTYAISANPYVHPIYGFTSFGSFIEETYFTDVLGNIFEIPKRIKDVTTEYRDLYGDKPANIIYSLLKENPAYAMDLLAGLLFLTPINIAKKFKAKFIEGWPLEKGGKKIVNRVMKMELKEPFVLFINMMEPHDPYVRIKKDIDWSMSFMKKQLSQESIDLRKKLYYVASKKALYYADRIMKNLDERFGDNQIRIVTSDHGQEFNEHGFIYHGVMLHDEIVKVPFAIDAPKRFMVPDRKYLSLVNVKKFILKAIANDSKAMNELYSGKIYSESFGIPSNIRLKKGIDLMKVEKEERYRMRIFQK
ncbi:MAG: sulfatase-like hydrolase/transferase [Candidatus Micrarchaeia archaeon]